jgi:hypothetical protein
MAATQPRRFPRAVMGRCQAGRRCIHGDVGPTVACSAGSAPAACDDQIRGQPAAQIHIFTRPPPYPVGIGVAVVVEPGSDVLCAPLVESDCGGPYVEFLFEYADQLALFDRLVRVRGSTSRFGAWLGENLCRQLLGG